MDDAIQAASSAHDFKLLVAGDGRTATSMDDLGQRTEAPAPAPTAPVAEPSPLAASAPSNGYASAPPNSYVPAPSNGHTSAPANGRPSAPPPGLLG
jgi:hypothetical protein